MEYSVNVKDMTKDYMISYHIITTLYDVRDLFLFKDEPISYNEITVNLKIFNYINEVNFIFKKDSPIVEDIKEKEYIGMLLNFKVYIDPTIDDCIIMSKEGESDVLIKVEF